METILVSRAGQLVGRVRFDPSTDGFDPDPGVPAGVASDIAVTYYRDNVLFGQSGDGYSWAEADAARQERCPVCGRVGSGERRASARGGLEASS
jgi:hypothetical protein